MSMLNPSMADLMKKVGNRYLLVNLAAQRARDLADEADETEIPLDEKSVQMALNDIDQGRIHYCPGPKEEVQPASSQMMGHAIGGAIDLDYAEKSEHVLLNDAESHADQKEKEEDDFDSKDDE